MREILLVFVIGVCAVLAACLMPKRLWRVDVRPRCMVLIPGVGDGDNLEYDVRQIIGLQGYGYVPVVADMGLNPEGRELALRLVRQWPEVIVWPGNHLDELLCRELGLEE